MKEISTGRSYSNYFTIDLTAGVAMPTPKTSTEGAELKIISYTLQELLQKTL